MKTLTRDEMKKVMGGDAPVPNGKCCVTGTNDCSACSTGLRCNSNATWVAC